MADHKAIFGLGVAAHETWFRRVVRFADVLFFVGECQFPPAMNGSVVCLNTPDVYPPQLKEFLMFQFFDLLGTRAYDFYFKADLDSYVNPDRLRRFLDKFAIKRQWAGYFGTPAMGRADEAGKLGLTKPYCLGLGYMLTWSTMHALARDAPACVQQFVSLHSDTEVCGRLPPCPGDAAQIGRCIADAQGIGCTELQEQAFVHNYYQVIDGEVLPSVLAQNGQTLAQFSTRPPLPFFHAVMLHPIKHVDEMALFHHQVSHNLRPLLPRIRPPSKPTQQSTYLYQHALQLTRKSCVHNSVYQLEVSNMMLTECKPPYFERPLRFPLIFNVMHLPSVAVAAVPRALAPLVRFRSVVVDEAHYRRNSRHAFLHAVRTVFLEAQAAKAPYVALLTQDVVLHCDAAVKLQQLLNESRCAGHLYTEHFGGVLLLGAREWTAKSWAPLVADIQRGRHGSKAEQQCYNIGSTTVGSFAAVFSASTFLDAVTWLNQTNGTQPLYELVRSLADVGYIVRAAFPYLAIQVPRCRAVAAANARRTCGGRPCLRGTRWRPCWGSVAKPSGPSRTSGQRAASAIRSPSRGDR